MKKYLSLIFMLLLAMQSVYAQDEKSFTAKGVVVDANNEPVIGATVVIKDKPGVGTVTDIDGNFSIKVNMYDNLVVSFIGFEQVTHRIIKEDETINIVLHEKGADVDEVVVVGMGSQRKVSVAGAITTIDPSELVKPATNIVNTLAGRVAGVIGVQSSGEPGKNISVPSTVFCRFYHLIMAISKFSARKCSRTRLILNATLA